MVERIEGEDTYITNLANNVYLPNGTSSATVNFRIWLLDDDDNELVVTLDTDDGIDYEDEGQLGYNLYQKELVNGWNWFSLNVEMEDMTLNDVFANTVVANTDNIKNQTTLSTFYGEPNNTWYPNFDMNVETHYQFNSSLGGEIIYYGDYLEPSENPINIVQGWNWIGFCPPYSLNVVDALGTLNLETGDIIKSQTLLAMYYDYAGGTWYPELVMDQTQGYMLQVANAGTLIYPEQTERSFNANVEVQNFDTKTRFLQNNIYTIFNYLFIIKSGDVGCQFFLNRW